MTFEEFAYLLPYLFSLALSLGIFIYSWRHRHMRGAGTYAWYIGAVTFTIFGFIMELMSPNLEIKVVWDQFQWITQLAYVVSFLIFALEFANVRLKHPRRTWAVLIAFPLAFTVLALTDGFHHIIYPNPHLSTDFPFPELLYDLSTIIYTYVLYVYLVTLYGIGLLLRRASQQNGIYRGQYLTIAIGFLIPLVLSVFIIAGIRLTPQRDNTPFTFVLGNLVVAWGLFRYKVFDLAPIAREQIVDNMTDPVFVLDPQNRLVHINHAALVLIGKREAEILGHTSGEAFARWPFVAELLENPEEQRREVSTKSKGELFFFDISISKIRNQRGQLLGRIVVARDITRHKYLEMNYRALSEELEQRIQQRTEELRTSAERYRAVVENQQEFIVRWKPDGTRTFVNEAYCRYLDVTPDQALTYGFMNLILEEDRPAVDEKISRLKSDASGPQTDVHRVIRPDGSIGWQEWTDYALRDEAGRLVEIQSVGRDITERKRAELAMQKSEERFSKAFHTSPIIITIFGIDTSRLIEVNDTFEKLSGFTREEVIGKTALELGLWAKPEDRELLLLHLREDGNIRNREIQFRTRDGNVLTGLVSAELIELDGELCGIAVIEDVTERKAAEARILRLNRLYVTISQINQTIVHARDKESLFQRICQVAIDPGHFRMAWIGLLEENQLRPFVFAGEEQGYLTDLDIDAHDPIQGSGPTGTAIQEGRCIICQDIAQDPRMAPWRTEALRRAYRSSAAVPIREQGRVIGALTVYAGEVHGFDAEDEALLEQIGMDVSFALDSIHAEQQREIAEHNLEEAYDTTLEGWARALELRDKETEGHSRRVTETTLIVARAMGISEVELVHIRRGSILHDIGKMGIPDEILRKNGPLSPEERVIVQKHPITAYNLLKSISFLQKALEIPYSHHEKWDGSGYPHGLKGNEIPLAARIFAIVDVWDALSSDRPYRAGWPKEKVTQYLCDEAGKHFDPEVLNVFLDMLNEGKI